jgi:ribonuclease Y
MEILLIVLAALVAATVSGAVSLGAIRLRGRPAVASGGHGARAPRTRSRGAGAHAGQGAAGLESDLQARQDEIGRLKERLRAREAVLDERAAEQDAAGRALAERERRLTEAGTAIEQDRRRRIVELERVSGLSVGEARQALLGELEQELRHERARLIRQIEDETRHDAERRARSILASCMQRMAGGHSAETTVTTVHLESDELKGRIIGREGRNIRALENLTGVDVIIDDTPGAVLLSGFDGVRREIARVTLEKLLEDGRIHPARIEEAYGQAHSELDRRIVELGEQAALEAGVGTVHPELTKLLGRLRFRTSYGQNVLSHSVECAGLAALAANELGANPKIAARAALLHDIGKAVSHEVEGPHALVGGELARRHKESEAVAHAVEAHHNEVEPQTVEAVIVQIVDALSGARPGARGASLEQYVGRLHDLEGVAARHPGVEKVYAMHAGRELRVIVKPGEIDDDGATILSRDIAREVERELEYPGQIKVTVIRESRSTEYAR